MLYLPDERERAASPRAQAEDELLTTKAELERRNVQLEALHRLLVAENSNADCDELLRVILGSLVDFSGAQYGLIYALKEDKLELTQYIPDLPEELLQPVREVSAESWKTDFLRLREKLGGSGSKSGGQVVYELATGGKLFGLSVLGSFEGEFPRRSDERMLLSMCESVASTLKRKKAESRLEFLSMHDGLTWLYNRTYFEEELKRVSAARLRPVSIIICDLDGLKLVNDLLGHYAGDQLLKQAARAISSPFRSSDVVARIGGDEFAVILPQTPEISAKRACERIKEEARKISATEGALPLSLSVGYATSGRDEPLDQVLKLADDNMYRDKMSKSYKFKTSILDSLVSATGQDDSLNRYGTGLMELAVRLAKSAGLSPAQIEALSTAVRVHDIGKIGIPDQVLMKQGPLTDEEKQQLERHTEIGYRIAMTSDELVPLAEIILHHHERWDGKGYPSGLSGTDIPLSSRILHIVDAYIAMTSDRPYRAALSHEEALLRLQQAAGKQFDPELVKRFTGLFQ